MADDETRETEQLIAEMKAYKTGYDLGYARALEAVKPKITEMAECIMHSDTIRKIEREQGKLPLFATKLMSLACDLQEMYNELLPVFIAEKKNINRLGRAMAKIPPEWFEPTEADKADARQIEDVIARYKDCSINKKPELLEEK